MPLNDKHRRFVEEYIVDLNATQAAIRAGYSEKTAYAQGQRLLKGAEIAAAVAEAQAARSERTKIDADWVLRRLAEEADADIADIYADDGSLKPVKDWPGVWRKGLVSGLDVEEVSAGAETTRRVSKVKLSDRLKRIELIGKHIGVQAFRDQVGVGNPDGSNLDDRSPEDIAEAVARKLAGIAAARDKG
jgi:phage terminase small subunit